MLSHAVCHGAQGDKGGACQGEGAVEAVTMQLGMAHAEVTYLRFARKIYLTKPAGYWKITCVFACGLSGLVVRWLER